MKRFYKLLVSLGVSTIASVASAESTTEYPLLSLKMAHFVPATASGAEWDQWWAEQIEERSGGNVKVQIFWAGSMGKTDEMFQLLQDGVIDLAVFPATYKPTELALTSVGGAVPNLFSDAKAASKQTEALYQLESVQGEWEVAGIEPLFSHSSNPYRIQCNKPLETIEDLKGVKVRSAGVYHPRLWQAVGAVPVATPLGEVYEALQYGNIQCAWMTLDNANSSRIYEVAKYAVDINTGSLATWQIYVNRDTFYDTWPENVRDLMREVSAEAVALELEAVLAAEEAAKADLAAKDVQFVEFKETEQFDALVPDLLEVWMKDMEEAGEGLAAKAVVEALRTRKTEK